MSDKMTVKVKLKIPVERKPTITNSGHRSAYSDYSKGKREAKRGGRRG